VLVLELNLNSACTCSGDMLGFVARIALAKVNTKQGRKTVSAPNSELI
jgi:hypothetical protein